MACRFSTFLANTIGGLAFLLIIAVMSVGVIAFLPPRIMTEVLPDGYDGQEYIAWVAAREGMGKFRWSLAEGMPPAGLVVDPETGKLSGAPRMTRSDGREQRFDFTVKCESRAQGESGTPKVDLRRFSLTVHQHRPLDTVPLHIATDDPLPPAYRRQPYPLVFAAEGGQPPYEWTGELPAGLTLTPRGGIQGAPDQTGRFAFEVTVKSRTGERKFKHFSLPVSENYPPPPPVPPLQVVTERVPSAVAERAYDLHMAAQGGTPPYTWGVEQGAPAWLELKPGGAAFTGTPGVLDIGERPVVWRVSDSGGRSALSDSIPLEVLPPAGKKPQPLRIKTASLPEARVELSYALAVAVEGGFAPYQWTARTDAPSGLELSPSDGFLSGTPGEAGTFPIGITVADTAGQSVDANLSLRVAPAIRPLAILTRGAHDGRVGDAYTLALAASGGYPPYRWRLAQSELPPGLRLDEDTGEIAGTPTEAGTWEVSMSFADADGRAGDSPLPLRFDILTRRGVPKLTITTAVLPAFLVGEEANLTLACEGGAAPYDWTIGGAMPHGLALNGGRITGTPVQAGEYELAVQVADSVGEQATAPFRLVVKRVVPYWLALLLAILVALAVIVILALSRILARRRAPVIPPLGILTKSVPNARASALYSVQLACMGGEPPYEWTVAGGELPPGLVLSADGVIAGCPFEGISLDETKEMALMVEVRDQRGSSARQEL